MSANELVLDEFFIDAISEVLNIGMGAAAASLSEMVEDEVTLSVPGVEFVSRLEAANIIGTKVTEDVSGVLQGFAGAINGDALLLFPEEQSLELVRAVLQEDLPLEELTELEQDAMTEIGNVILNACVSNMADLFEKTMIGEVPAFVKGSLGSVLSVEQDKGIVLLLKMDFSIQEKNIHGYVTFLMDFASITELQKNIEAFLGDE
ncbi:MAG: chemotaxis protein CheC [Methyloprofundus sp.]|nr:MAG: chemotaxis protein CheC [Methyloprofundus sp.]